MRRPRSRRWRANASLGAFIVRFGRAPKRAVLFRTNTPFAKIKRGFGEPDTPEGDCEKLELLCDGQQIICFGVHPDTGKAYSWHGGEPGEIERRELPSIDEDGARALIDAASALLVDKFGYRLKPAKGAKRPNGAGADDEPPTDWSFTPDDLTDHDRLAAFAMKLVKSGMGAGAAVNFLRGAVAGLANVEEDRRQRRLKEIPGMVASAEAKANDEPDAEHGKSRAKKSNGGGEAASKRIKVIMGSDVMPEAIAWLWPDWLAHGKLHILAGRPGTLKTTTALSLAATVTVGGKWPDGSLAAPGNVIIWSGEDAVEDTLLPRFIAAGGDPAQIAFVGGVDEDGKKRSFDPAADMDALVDLCDRMGSFNLVVIDPIVAVAKSDSHKNAETRRDLQPLVDLAERTKAAVLGIHHLTKRSEDADPVDRVSGSLAFGAGPPSRRRCSSPPVTSWSRTRSRRASAR